MMKHIRRLSTFSKLVSDRHKLREALIANQSDNMDLIHKPSQYPVSIACEQYGVLPMVCFDKTYGPSIARRLLPPLIEAQNHGEIFGVWFTDAKWFGPCPPVSLNQQLRLCGTDSLDIFRPEVVVKPAVILIDNLFSMNDEKRIKFIQFLLDRSNENKGPFFVLCGHISDK